MIFALIVVCSLHSFQWSLSFLCIFNCTETCSFADVVLDLKIARISVLLAAGVTVHKCKNFDHKTKKRQKRIFMQKTFGKLFGPVEKLTRSIAYMAT